MSISSESEYQCGFDCERLAIEMCHWFGLMKDEWHLKTKRLNTELRVSVGSSLASSHVKDEAGIAAK